VRWALDIKHVPHRRRSLLPGLHRATLKRQTGRTVTPVLLHDGIALDGSARILAKGNGITGADAVEDGLRAATVALDFVAARGVATGYLCGNAFSVADLTAASTLAVLIRPVNSPMSSPQPVARGFRELMDRYADHPGAAWVRGIDEPHRGARSDFDGPSEEAA
jgi:hypothetical protein